LKGPTGDNEKRARPEDPNVVTSTIGAEPPLRRIKDVKKQVSLTDSPPGNSKRKKTTRKGTIT